MFINMPLFLAYLAKYRIFDLVNILLIAPQRN